MNDQTKKWAPAGIALASFLGAGVCFGFSLNWLLLPSQEPSVLGLYSTTKFVAIVGLLTTGFALAWCYRRCDSSSQQKCDVLGILVIASLACFGAQLLSGINIAEGGDVVVNLLAVDQKVHRLKERVHSLAAVSIEPTGLLLGERTIEWYPPGPTWLIHAATKTSGWSPVRVAQILWVACYLTSAALLAIVMRILAVGSREEGSPWLSNHWRAWLLAGSILWWIEGCNLSEIGNTELLALPLSLLVSIGCLRILAGRGSPAIWIVSGLMGGMIYWLKPSQFVCIAAMLAVTGALICYRARNLRAILSPALGAACLLAPPAALTVVNGWSKSAASQSFKEGIQTQQYIQKRYGDRYESASSVTFAAAGTLGGIGWNSLGYGALARLPWFFAGISPLNWVWERLAWNNVCSWCLILGLILTPVAWWSLAPSFKTPLALVLPGTAVVTVLLLAAIGYHKGWQWNVGLESGGRLLLPISAVVAVSLVLRCSLRRRGAFLLAGTAYVFATWPTVLKTEPGSSKAGADGALHAVDTRINSEVLKARLPRWTADARRRGATALFIAVSDLEGGIQASARGGRLQTFGSVLPIGMLEEAQLYLLKDIPPKETVGLLLTPALRQVAAEAALEAKPFVGIEP